MNDDVAALMAHAIAWGNLRGAAYVQFETGLRAKLFEIDGEAKKQQHEIAVLADQTVHQEAQMGQAHRDAACYSI